MKTKLEEFGFHGDAGDAEPTGSFGLIALCEFDGASENLAFSAFQNASMDVGNFATARSGEEFVDVITKGD